MEQLFSPYNSRCTLCLRKIRWAHINVQLLYFADVPFPVKNDISFISKLPVFPGVPASTIRSVTAGKVAIDANPGPQPRWKRELKQSKQTDLKEEGTSEPASIETAEQ